MLKTRIFGSSLLCMILAVMGSCKGKETKTPSDDNSQALKEASAEELQTAVSDRDELLSLVNEISDGMNRIKTLENIMTTDRAETPSQREQIRRDIAAIQAELEQRRARLVELETKLSSSNLYTDKLQKTISGLKQQIEEQTAEIARLSTELTTARQQIETLGSAVDSLNTTVDNVTSERDEAQQMYTEAENELNTCYYVAASKDELKRHKILETGFLRKTKLMKGSFEQSFFTQGDKRTLKQINTYSKKAKVLTNQPADSYQITEVNGQKVIQITNPTRFWSLSNYLVVEID